VHPVDLVTGKSVEQARLQHSARAAQPLFGRPEERVAAVDLRDLHDLLLVDDGAVGVLQDGLEVGVGVLDGLAAVLAVDEVVHHARRQRARTVQRQQRDERGAEQEPGPAMKPGLEVPDGEGPQPPQPRMVDHQRHRRADQQPADRKSVV